MEKTETETKRDSSASECNDWLSSDLSLRTLLLILSDFTHTIDELEETDANPTFEHTISRDVVIKELRAMRDYLSHVKRNK
jgi:hypothetical protein